MSSFGKIDSVSPACPAEDLLPILERPSLGDSLCSLCHALLPHAAEVSVASTRAPVQPGWRQGRGGRGGPRSSPWTRAHHSASLCQGSEIMPHPATALAGALPPLSTHPRIPHMGLGAWPAVPGCTQGLSDPTTLPCLSALPWLWLNGIPSEFLCRSPNS